MHLKMHAQVAAVRGYVGRQLARQAMDISKDREQVG
jgi:hypothetical protein